jgi:hypothetical protein
MDGLDFDCTPSGEYSTREDPCSSPKVVARSPEAGLLSNVADELDKQC